MAKSNRPRRKRASARRPTSSARTSKRSSGSKRNKTAVIELKPIRVLIARTIDRLRRSPDQEAVKLTIERLERCLAEFDAICDPESNLGCGPTMTFPA